MTRPSQPTDAPSGPVTPLSVGFNTDPLTSSLGYDLGTRAPRLAESTALHPVGRWLSRLGVDTGKAALGGALLGGAIGAGAGAISGRGALPGASVGALAGGGGSALLSALVSLLNRPTVKQAFYATGEESPLAFVQQRLFADTSSDSRLRSFVLQSVGGLPPDQLQSLQRLLRGSVTGGAVYLVARYLLQLGVGGSTLLALLGGLAGARSGGGPRDVYGERMSGEYDPFGRRRLVI